ncbi:MAG: sigma-70 family RNA polymerase sigma factor [Gemmatales bacterium]
MYAADLVDCDSLKQAARGDQAGWQAVIARHHARLRRMVGLRLDPRLRGRVDPSDVLQEVYLDATRDLPNYLEKKAATFAPFIWLRQLAGTRLAKIHRTHLDAQTRDVRKEVPLHGLHYPGVSSVMLAEEILAISNDPGKVAAHADLRFKVLSAIESLDEIDREVLILRHFEHLTTEETAVVLNITTAATGKRYLRALERLREVLTDSSTSSEEMRS